MMKTACVFNLRSMNKLIKTIVAGAAILGTVFGNESNAMDKSMPLSDVNPKANDALEMPVNSLSTTIIMEESIGDVNAQDNHSKTSSHGDADKNSVRVIWLNEFVFDPTTGTTIYCTSEDKESMEKFVEDLITGGCDIIDLTNVGKETEWGSKD